MQNTEADRIQVVAGLVFNADWRVLVARRTTPDRYYGKWEFPGGKIRNGEAMTDALARELDEELGIDVLSATPFDSFPYDYPDRKVMLNFWRVKNYGGWPKGLENQELRWIGVGDFSALDVLAPNVRVFERLDHWLKTDETAAFFD